MSDRLNLLKDVFVPIFIAIITMKLTTEHDKRIKKENFRIELYYIYEDIRERLEKYYKGRIENNYESLKNKDRLSYKEALSKFNIFISKFQNEKKLNLEELKSLIDFKHNITILDSRFYREFDLVLDKSEEAMLIQKGLDKIYDFLDYQNLDRIKLYTTDDIKEFKEKKYAEALYMKRLEKDQIESMIEYYKDELGEFYHMELISGELPEDIGQLKYEVIKLNNELDIVEQAIKYHESKLDMEYFKGN